MIDRYPLSHVLISLFSTPKPFFLRPAAGIPVSIEEPHGTKRDCDPSSPTHSHTDARAITIEGKEHSHSHGHSHDHTHKEASAHPHAQEHKRAPSHESQSPSETAEPRPSGSQEITAPLRPKKSLGATTLRLRKAIVVSVAISIHSLISGMGLGIANTFDAFWSIFAAIAAHKIFDGFVVGTQAVRGNSSWLELLCIGGPSVLAEPIGIIIGMNIPSESDWTTGILMGLVAGCFIFIGATEVPMDELETQEHAHCSQSEALTRTHSSPAFRTRLLKFLAMICGVATMALTNIALAKGQGAEGAHSAAAAGGHRRLLFSL